MVGDGGGEEGEVIPGVAGWLEAGAPVLCPAGALKLGVAG